MASSTQTNVLAPTNGPKKTKKKEENRLINGQWEDLQQEIKNTILGAKQRRVDRRDIFKLFVKLKNMETQITQVVKKEDYEWQMERVQQLYQKHSFRPGNQDNLTNSLSQIGILTTVSTLLLGFSLSSFFAFSNEDTTVPLIILGGIASEFFALLTTLFMVIFQVSDYSKASGDYARAQRYYVHLLYLSLTFVLLGVLFNFAALVFHTWTYLSQVWGIVFVCIYGSITIVFIILFILKGKDKIWRVIDQ